MILNPWKEIKRLRVENDLLHETLEERSDYYMSMLTREEQGSDAMRDVLVAIIREETPSANATVKRICKMARRALS